MTVKLSYKDGVLSGTETYQSKPTDEYWRDNYPELSGSPREFEFSEDTALPMKNGEFLLVWIKSNNFDSAVEITVRDAEHFPDKEMSYADVKASAVEPKLQSHK